MRLGGYYQRPGTRLGRQYVAYGADAPGMGLTELYTNWRQRRVLIQRGELGVID